MKPKYNTYLYTLRLKIMRCVICNQEVDVIMLKKHMARIHRSTIQFDQELRHYLYSLKKPINKKDFVFLQCNRSFPNNWEYYLHKLVKHNRLDYGGGSGAQQQVGGAVADDVEVIQQDQINAWRVMTYMVTPAEGRTDWGIYVASVGDKFKRKLASFIRAENALNMTLQVKSGLLGVSLGVGVS